MPYSIIWDEDKNGLLVLGLVTIDEMGKFKTDVDQAIREHRGAANWHAPLMGMLDTIIHPHPNRPGMKIDTIKLWRMISSLGLKEAKEYIEAVVEGRLDPPAGDEFPDLSETDAQYFVTRLQLHNLHTTVSS